MLTYVQATVIGVVQGVTELFPVSSLGHSVLFAAPRSRCSATTGGTDTRSSPVSAPRCGRGEPPRWRSGWRG
jgi:hypothetical protein